MREYLDTTNVPLLTAEEIESIEDAGAQRHQQFFVCLISWGIIIVLMKMLYSGTDIVKVQLTFLG
jgi:hypothetical protein